MPWSGEQRGFVIEAFFENAESVTAAHGAFRTRFDLSPNETVPNRKTILKWVENLRATESAMPKEPARRPKTMRTFENIAAVRASIEQFPSRFARKMTLLFGYRIERYGEFFTAILNYTQTRLWLLRS